MAYVDSLAGSQFRLEIDYEVMKQQDEIFSSLPSWIPLFFDGMKIDELPVKTTLCKISIIRDSMLDSLKDALLRTNHRPSPAQQQTLEALITQQSADATQIRDDILGFQLQIDRLLVKIKEKFALLSRKKEWIAECKALLAPVRLLPSEILRKIFKYWVLPDFKFPSDSWSPILVYANPLVLFGVSTIWRQAALEYPTWWNDILQIDQAGLTQSPSERKPFSYTDNDCRLLSLTWGTGQAVTAIPKFANRIIIPFIALLSEMNLHLPSGYAGIFAFLTESSAPFLESLSIKTESNIPLFQFRILQGAPSLRRILLDIGLFSFDRSISPFLASKKVTHLKIQSAIAPSWFATTMFQCPALEEGSFWINMDYEGSSRDGGITHINIPAATPVLFPCLRVLDIELFLLTNRLRHLSSWTWMDISRVTSNMELPILHSLNWVSQTLMAPILLSDIVDPQVHTLSTIRSLTLVRVIFNTPTELATLLAACPLLETLVLFPAKPKVHGHGMTATAVLHECAVAHLPALRKLTAAFYTRNEREVTPIVKAFADLLRIWSKDPSMNRAGADLGLFVFPGDKWGPFDQDGANREMIGLHNQFAVGGGYRAGDSDIGFSFKLTTGIFPEKSVATRDFFSLQRSRSSFKT
ncbi:hypothetical protein H0H81_012330 [Sphagnurus paluster]|uniref:F-box domain-containing protein n=1 Tax=Sphagnurus paluster TaxID=117069 RepID=A0A9P7GGW4_9AGAR|nr:hypothetical protein H0H81_012330 [Sphagnurus paluster]